MLAMADSLFLRACRRQPVERTPIWMMRQAGRYLPAYRAVRARASFLELCRSPDLACEVTLQPIDEFGFDAAILFSDILITLPAMGIDVAFPDAGPKIAAPIRSHAAIEALHVPDPEAELPFVMEAVRRIKAALAGRVPLIGFAGAPLTMLTYAVEGGGSKDYAHTKALLFGAPASAHALLDKLARTCASYLEAQIAAGADAVQIFDSWGGIVSPGDFREFPLRYAQQVIELLRASPVVASRRVPII
jgi:uroporphyrinogen decarboxylase